MEEQRVWNGVEEGKGRRREKVKRKKAYGRSSPPPPKKTNKTKKIKRARKDLTQFERVLTKKLN